MFQFMQNIFRGRGRAAMERLSCEQLDDERIRLEAMQDAIIKRIRGIENIKRNLFEDGVRKGSDMERRALAVKIKQSDEEARDYQAQHVMLSNRIQITGKLLRLKRQMELIKDAGLWSLVAGLEPSRVEAFMLDIKTRSRQGDVQASRLLEIMGDGDELSWRGDPEIDRIVEAMSSCRDPILDDHRWQEVSARICGNRATEKTNHEV